MRRALVLGGLVLTLAVPNALVVGKERLRARGTPMLLELAPVDPRSLIQGDYMRLDYEISRQVVDSQRVWPRRGELVVTLDENDIARLARRHVPGTPLREGEHLLAYHRRDGRIQIGSNAFHFREGDASRYAAARYGEVRVAPSGESVLVALRDGTRRVLGRS